MDFSYPALADADGTNRIYIEGVRPPDPPVTPGPRRVKVIGFTTSGAGVYDVRDPRHPVQITTTEYASGTLTFWDADLPGLTYYLSTEAALQTPAAIETRHALDLGHGRPHGGLHRDRLS